MLGLGNVKNRRNMCSMKKGYAKVPIEIFNAGLSPFALGMYCLFISLPEDFDPALSFLSSTLKISRNTVIKYLKELESRNIIKKYHTGGPNAGFSKYEFVARREWL